MPTSAILRVYCSPPASDDDVRWMMMLCLWAGWRHRSIDQSIDRTVTDRAQPQDEFLLLRMHVGCLRYEGGRL